MIKFLEKVASLLSTKKIAKSGPCGPDTIGGDGR